MAILAWKITPRRAALALAAALLAWARPAAAWHGWPYSPHPWPWPRAVPGPAVLFPAALPAPGYRLFHPPGLPLSYHEPGTGTTYCLSQATGLYFVCGYSRPARDRAEPPPRLQPPGLPHPGDEAPPAPSGVLLFRLPWDAEAALDGEPVGLSGGLGIAAVAPGQHRVVLRLAGRETAETVSIASHAILTITATGIFPPGH